MPKRNKTSRDVVRDIAKAGRDYTQRIFARADEIQKRKEAGEPGWIWSTPDDVAYRLEMSNAEEGQAIELTRAEFIELKACLTKTRGYAPAPALPEAAHV